MCPSINHETKAPHSSAFQGLMERMDAHLKRTRSRCQKPVAAARSSSFVGLCGKCKYFETDDASDSDSASAPGGGDAVFCAVLDAFSAFTSAFFVSVTVGFEFPSFVLYRHVCIEFRYCLWGEAKKRWLNAEFDSSEGRVVVPCLVVTCGSLSNVNGLYDDIEFCRSAEICPGAFCEVFGKAICHIAVGSDCRDAGRARLRAGQRGIFGGIFQRDMAGCELKKEELTRKNQSNVDSTMSGVPWKCKRRIQSVTAAMTEWRRPGPEATIEVASFCPVCQ